MANGVATFLDKSNCSHQEQSKSFAALCKRHVLTRPRFSLARDQEYAGAQLLLHSSQTCINRRLPDLFLPSSPFHMLNHSSPGISTMQLTSSSSPIAIRLPISGRPLRPPSGHRRCRKIAASRDADNREFGGRIVDENMFVLRRRIHEMKMVERNYEAPAGWMDWEKKYHLAYVSHVHEGVGLLQKFLIGTRPSVAVGIMVLVGLSVPTAASLVLFNLIAACNWIFGLPLHR
ncbi:hypothetical protein EJ110_NYTH06658 [Nymphaea thermarum]|nr:hypothetical protein EJ110_NYTH06658 [Nymphaea thermarum]